MYFIFWQNIISIHQSAFIAALSQDHTVTLIVESEISENRKSSGWSIPNMGKATIIVSPTLQEINLIIDKNQDAIHYFSGINAFPMVYTAFKICVKQHCQIGVYSEPYYDKGTKGFLKKIKYFLLFQKYGNAIDFFLTTGTMGINCFRKSGFPMDRLFQWGYFTDSKTHHTLQRLPESNVSILFVGALIARKNIKLLIKTFIEINNEKATLTIVGDGPLREEIVNMAKQYLNISYLGNASNQEVRALMNQRDILVLPSRFDGWGAVVNEALQCGMRVLTSNNCGASILLDGKQRGELFSTSKKSSNNLKHTLSKWINKGIILPFERKEIQDWSTKHISGEIGSNYFINICQYIYKKEGNRPVVPWIK